MRLLDEQYLKTPFYGWPKLTAWLRQQGFAINHKRVLRLMQLMGLQAIYPKPKTSLPGQGHKIYPYLLRDVRIERPNHVWVCEIVCTQMTKTGVFAVWGSRDGVADLDLVIGYHNPIN